VDNVDLDAATRRGVLVLNTPGGNAISVAETYDRADVVNGAVHSGCRDVGPRGQVGKEEVHGTRAARKKRSASWELGRIGVEVARRARVMEMQVVAYDPYVSPVVARDNVNALLSFEELCAKSDYITLHMALTPESTGIINAAAIAQIEERRAPCPTARVES